MRSTGQNSLGLGSKPEKNRGLGGTSILMDRICYPKYQSHKCEELLVDSWQKISAQLMRWVTCKEQSLSDSSQRIQFLSNTQFIATWESSNTTYVSFSKNIEMKQFYKIVDFLNSLLHIIPHWTCILRVLQNWTALAGMGQQPVQCFAVQMQPLWLLWAHLIWHSCFFFWPAGWQRALGS